MVFFFNDTATTEIYTLSLHDALPILTGTISLDCEDVNIAQGRINGTIGTFGASPGIYDECSISITDDATTNTGEIDELIISSDSEEDFAKIGRASCRERV